MKFLILLVLLFSTQTFGQEKPKKRQLVICGNVWYPFTFYKGEDFNQGISIEIASLILKKLNFDFTFRDIPWTRCKQGVRNGEYDAILDATPDGNLYAPKAYASFFPIGLYTKIDNSDAPEVFTWQSMIGKRVGLIKTYDYPGKINQFKGWYRIESETEEKSLMKLKANRFDFILTDVFTADLLAPKMKIKLKQIPPLVAFENLFLVFNIKDKAIADDYSRELEGLINDGTVDRIFKKYLHKTFHELDKNNEGVVNQ
ncbi:ABC transporter, substrate-binding protein, family 3 [Bacteriovorax sp. BSW11_IV]|uniref:substrate-binding periplasmic protein n=1 Tax=Bacteriovorax sp. BSW11_IV TaxID=1353529 RepID=UPI00038A1E47|nr:transporter substrate-binding domain-containing protein [Bacteriovorax sp. BSW11_IV]EQC46751.1 ABC transporter, substrate-binding protein, family 3 [Bacteriovorax sp. BSW11_IV]